MGSFKVLYDYPNFASLPAVGEVSKLYITNDNNTLYRWVDGAYAFFTTTSVPWGNIAGTITNQADLMALINARELAITSGTTAQYWRGDKTFQTLNTAVVPESGNLYYTQGRFDSAFGAKSTTNLAEGTNLYYTQGRFNSAFGAKSTSDLAEGSNLYYTDGRFDTRLASKSTSNLVEGINLYYTQGRFNSAFTAKKTDDLSEGTTNFYYTSNRFNADFNSKNTDALAEGISNVYFTAGRARNAIALTTVGSGGAATYNPTTGVLNIPTYEDNLVDPLAGAGSAGYLGKYTGSTSVGVSQIFDNGVYVGVNRTNPFYTLDINGTLNVEQASIFRALAGTGNRIVYVDSTGQITPAIIGGGLSLSGNTLSATGTASGSIGGSGTSNFVTKFTGTAAIGNSSIQDSGTLVTINNPTNIVGDLGVAGWINGAFTKVLPTGNTFASGQTINLTSSANGAILINRNTWNLNSDAFDYNGYQIYDNRLLLNKSVTGANPSILFASQVVNNGTAQQYAITYYSTNGGSSGTGTYSTFTHYQAGLWYGQGGNTSTYTNYNGFVVNFPANNVTNATGLTVENITASGNARGLDLKVSAGTNKHNIYAQGTAQNYLSGALGIGITTPGTSNLVVARNITGATTLSSIIQYGTVQSDVTTSVFGIRNDLYTQAATFTLTDYYHFSAQQQTIGSGSVVTNQYGFIANGSLTGATNNYGFFGNIAASTGRWNLYMAGTANNYMAGGLGIGSTSLGSLNGIVNIGKNLTGGINQATVNISSVVQSDVTNAAIGYQTSIGTQASTFTLSEIRHFQASQGTFGSGSTISTQSGFWVAGLNGAGNNYGFRGLLSSASNRWNLFIDGTAQNYLAGALSIGVTTANASALLQVDSTTQGVLFPRMTTTQKNAITSPAVGLIIYDTTLNKLCVYTGAWQTITSA